MTGFCAFLLFAVAILVALPNPRWRLQPPAAARLHLPWGQIRAGPDLLQEAAELALFATCLKAGLAVTAAAGVVARTTGTTSWATVAALTNLGLDPQRAFSPLAGEMTQRLAGVVASSWASGAAIHSGCTALVAELRERAQNEATARGERAGVLIALPLTCCFLPAFFILGLVPTIIGLGSSLLELF